MHKVTIPILGLKLRQNVTENERITAPTLLELITKDGFISEYMGIFLLFGGIKNGRSQFDNASLAPSINLASNELGCKVVVGSKAMAAQPVLLGRWNSSARR